MIITIIKKIFSLGLLLFLLGGCSATITAEATQGATPPLVEAPETPELNVPTQTPILTVQAQEAAQGESAPPEAPPVTIETQEEAPDVSAPPQAPSVKLPNQQLTDQKLEALIQQGLFHQAVAEVELPGNQITAAGLKAILATPIRSLQVLNLYGNQIGDEGALALGQSEKVKGVNRLDVSNNGLTLEGIKALFGKDSKLTGPIWIDVSGNEIGDEGVSIILENTYIEHLEGLVLRRIGLTDAGAEALSKASERMKLQYLDVSGNNLTEAGRAALSNSPSLKNTRVLFE